MIRPNLKSVKDKDVISYIEYLENQLKTPYINSFLSLKSLVDRGNKQLSDTANEQIDFESKAFAAVSKFISLQKGYYEQMDYFKSKMNPEEVKKTQVTKSEGVEEFLKEKGKL